MRKTVIVLALVVLVAAGAAADISIGGEYLFYTSGLTHNALLSLRLWPQPIQLGLGVTFGAAPSFSITGDYWLRAGRLAGPFGYYIALGAFIDLPDVAFGARVPIGLQLWPLGNVLELFLEAVPYAGILVTPTTGMFGVGLGAGFRFWFD
jgi:hypothetical protein